MTPQRGALTLELDRPRILFYDAAAVSLLYAKYKMGFYAALYTVTKVEKDGKGAVLAADFELTSVEALHFYLWAGLQADAGAHGETLTLAQVGNFIKPYSFHFILNAVIRAFSDATYTPPAKPGNAPADEAPAAPPAPKKPGHKVPYTKKRSTGKMPSGSRSQR